MKAGTALFALAAVVCALVTSPASAQECPCNCYFSSDCEGGAFCDWGTLSQEDSCFWRTPKPQGTPGAGCDQEYGDWGQCDGICSGASAVQIFKDEKIGDLIGGVNLWSTALTNAAVAGGGVPDGALVQQVGSIQYAEPRMADSMWRVTVEVLMLARGSDFLVFPDAEEFHSEQVQAKDLSRDSQLVRLGDLAIAALMAEIEEQGSGYRYIEQAAVLGLDERLDESMFARFCNGQSALGCLYGKISDIGDAVGRGGRVTTMAATGAGGCAGQDPLVCAADINNDGIVGVDDLVALFLRWGPVTSPTPADIDGDLVIGVNDMIIVIEMWGQACSE